MKRLPLVLAVIITVICFITITAFLSIPLAILWLLGADKPFCLLGDITDGFDKIVYFKKR